MRAAGGHIRNCPGVADHQGAAAKSSTPRGPALTRRTAPAPPRGAAAAGHVWGIVGRPMDPERLRALLEAVEAGSVSIDDALSELRELPFRDARASRASTPTDTCAPAFPRSCSARGRRPSRSRPSWPSSRGRARPRWRPGSRRRRPRGRRARCRRRATCRAARDRGRADAGARRGRGDDRRGQRRDGRHPGGRGGGADRRARRQPRRAPLRRRRRRAAPPARPAARRSSRRRSSSSSPGWRARCPASSPDCSRGR